MRWLYWENLWCLAAVALIIATALIACARSLRIRRRFLDGSPSWRLWVKVALRGLAVVLAGLAALGPSWGEREYNPPPASGRDVLVLLDVSRSMLAEDARPNRLESAKGGLRELARHFEARGGYRIGLITFADRAAVLCPLTSDFRHFYQELDEASLEGLRLKRETAIVVDGTQLSLALLRARTALAHPAADHDAHCDLVLVSDGGDETATELATETENLTKLGVHVLAVGVGDPQKGSPIPLVSPRGLRENLTFQGRQVETRLQAEPLQFIAEKSGGLYVPANVGEFPSSALVRRIESHTVRELTPKHGGREPILRYEWFLLPAVIILLIEQIISNGRIVKMGKMGYIRADHWLGRVVPNGEVGSESSATVGSS